MVTNWLSLHWQIEMEQTIFPLFGIFMNILQGQLTTLTGEEIDYSKGEEAKVGFLERFVKVDNIAPFFGGFWKQFLAVLYAYFQNGMGVLATLRHHKDFVDALKDEPFVAELKKSLDSRTRS